MYFPNYDKFVVSEKMYERYAFNSYYEVDMEGFNIQSITKIEKAVKNYDYKWEMVSLFIRIVVTIIIEVMIALLFGFSAKKQLLIIGAVNIATQSLLNILLNVINYNHGSTLFILNYIWMELLVFIIEALIFYITLHKYSNVESNRKWLAVVYAFTANLVSFADGIIIALFVPGIF